MLSIRLSRVGRKNNPLFRLIILDKQKDPWGDFIENLGHFNPKTKEISLNAERIKFWLAKGAQPSNTVHNLFVTNGIISDKKRRVSRLSKKRKEKIAKEQSDKQKTAAAASPPANEQTPTAG